MSDRTKRETVEEVFALVEEHGIEKTAEIRGNTVGTIARYLTRYQNLQDEELVEENVKYKKQTQKYQDTNRIERKAFREQARVENAVSALNAEFIKLVRENKFKSYESKEIVVSENPVYGIIQLSDHHLNELVELPRNKYDIGIASKRLKKHIDKSILDFTFNGVTDVLVAFTGDMINSDRRLDEMLNQATNRTRAQFLAVELYKQALEQLSDYFNINVSSVTGNESRVKDIYEWSDVCVTDNYDYAINGILELLFEDNDRVQFCGDCKIENVVRFGGKNVLLIHGNQIKGDISKSISKIIRKYSDADIKIDYVLFGHIHESLIADLYARSASLVGGNAFSDNGLQLTSRASQNRFRIEDGEFIGTVQCLQNVDDYEGYNISEKLMKYNAKSANKNREKVTVFEIVI